MTYIARNTTARILRFFSGFSDRGFCSRCERDTEWIERDHYYRCSGCGNDPVMNETEPLRPVARFYRLNDRSAA